MDLLEEPEAKDACEGIDLSFPLCVDATSFYAVHIHTYTQTDRMYMYVSVRVYMCIYIYECLSMYIYIYGCMIVCICVGMHACMQVVGM